MQIQERDIELSSNTDVVISPVDYGFPANPTLSQRRCWINQERFLECFRQLGSVGTACTEARVPVSTAEKWVQADRYAFKKRRDEAAAIALGVLEREIHRRAVEGIERKLHFRGQVFDTERQFSDNLLMFRAKRLDPAYKDNYQAPEVRPNTVTQINIHLHPSVKLPDTHQ